MFSLAFFFFFKMGDNSAYLYADRNNAVERGNTDEAAQWQAGRTG